MWNNKFNVIIIYALIAQLLSDKLCCGLFEFNNKDTEQNAEVTFTNDDLLNAIIYAEQSLERLKRLENSISNSRITIRNQSISYAQLLENLPDDQSKYYDRNAQLILSAGVRLLNVNCLKFGFHAHKCAEEIARLSLPDSHLRNVCIENQEAISEDGLNIYRRLLPAYYRDGLYKIPQNHHQPEPKIISDALFNSHQNPPPSDQNEINDEGVLDAVRNIALVQWAQFIEHDLAKTVVRTMENNKPIECCADDLSDAPPRYKHPSCSPLKVEESSTNNRYVTCLNYVRSAVGVNTDCHFGAANQLNQATNKLDLSQLYGYTVEVTNSLRRFKNGELKYSGNSNKPCLPVAVGEEDYYCMHRNSSDTNNVCYRSGDSRVNVNPYVTTLYTIFLRSHNRIAKQIKKSKRSWKDDKIFRRARTINTAIYAKIVYEEWAKILLGDSLSAQINHEPIMARNQNALISAVSNEFATAGIRFYYSMMPGDLTLLRDGDDSEQNYSNNIIISTPRSSMEMMHIDNEYYKPRNLGENNELDVIMQAILTQRAMAMDSGYVDDVTKYMYRFKYSAQPDIGTDVLALDLMRGRDHGLSGYIKYFESCNRKKITDWTDLKDYISDTNLNRLKSIYDNVEMIDLIIGAISENAYAGATVGPTFACIIGEQLSNIRQNDLQFYKKNVDIDNKIASYTGTRLLCETTSLQHVPANIFKIPSKENPLIDCSTFSDYAVNI